MNYLKLVIPAALLLYFIYRSFGERIFLLGIPFLMYMKQAVFFEKMKPFWIPGKIGGTPLLNLIWLVPVWMICTDMFNPKDFPLNNDIGIFGKRRLEYAEIPIILLSGIWAINLIRGMADYSNLSKVIDSAEGLGCMFAAYFMIRGIIANSKREHVLKFLESLVFVNLIASIIYVVENFFKISIYGLPPNSITTYMGVTIARTFWAMPPLLTLAFAFTLAKSKWNVYSGVVLVLSSLAVFFSYSRGLVIPLLAVVVIALFLRMFKSGQGKVFIQRLILVGISVAVVSWFLLTFLPVQTRFLVSRFQEFTEISKIPQKNNFQYRIGNFQKTMELIRENDLLFGKGFPDPGMDTHAVTIANQTADIAWVGILYKTGVVGIVLFVSLFILFGVRALRLYFSSSGQAEVMGLIFFCLIVATVLESINSWVFMDPRKYVLGLWFLAFLSAEASRTDPVA
jgi:hypothetical protein